MRRFYYSAFFKNYRCIMKHNASHAQVQAAWAEKYMTSP